MMDDTVVSTSDEPALQSPQAQHPPHPPQSRATLEHTGNSPSSENQDNVTDTRVTHDKVEATSDNTREPTEPRTEETKSTGPHTKGDGRKGGGGESLGEEAEDEEELKLPREHGRLDGLLSQIPRKAQHGLLMQCDLILTCVDANEHFIALGTNIGLTFLYNRKDHSLQRLRSETSGDVITCVKLHSGLDHQLAAGMASGTVCIFLIPALVSLHKKQLQKFEVRAVHRHYVSCAEWSTNGMKLFTGDKAGHVVLTKVDFYQGECESEVLLVEPPTEVIQLSYDHRMLLVSTRHRSFVCRLDSTREIVQIGQQDRKVLGNYGAVFIPGLCKAEDAKLYAARPGYRVWLSDIAGSVLYTHIFKEPVSGSLQELPVLQPAARSFNPHAERQFGRVHVYGDSQLLTYNTTTLFLLHPHRNLLVGTQSRVGGIVDVAVHADEIFVLRRHGDAALIRLAYLPDTCTSGLPVELSPPSTAAPPSVKDAEAKSQKTEESGEESKTKAFFKKTFFSPFKKLPGLLQDRNQASDAQSADLRPVIQSADVGGDKSSPSPSSVPSTLSSPVPSSLPSSQHSEDQLPPIVALDSPDLAVRLFRGSGSGSATPTNIQSPDSADSALSVFSEEVRDIGKVMPEVKVTGPLDNEGMSAAEGVSGTMDTSLPGGQTLGSEDIVFQHKKRHKKKKNKGKAEQEADSISQSSISSQVSEETRGETSDIDDVLRRAEEALTNVDMLLKGDNHSKQAEARPKEVSSETVPSEVSSQIRTGPSEASANLSTVPNEVSGNIKTGPSKESGSLRTGPSEESGSMRTGASEVSDSIRSDVSEGLFHADSAGGKGVCSMTLGGGEDHGGAVSQSPVTGDQREPLRTQNTHIKHREEAATMKQGGVADNQNMNDSETTSLKAEVGRVPQSGTDMTDSGSGRPGQHDPEMKPLSGGPASHLPLSSFHSVVPGSDKELSRREASVEESGSQLGRTNAGDSSSVPGTSQLTVASCETAPHSAPENSGGVRAAPEDPLLAAERTLDSMTQRYKLPVKREESTDDFYNMFSSPYSPADPFESPTSVPKDPPSFVNTNTRVPSPERQVSSGSSGGGSGEATILKLSNNWSELTAPANIYSLSLSSSHVWFTDKSENLYYSALGSAKGIVWRKVSEPAHQISVSPSGHIVWRLYRGRVFAGTKITQRRPEGLKWVEAVNNVAHISVDNHSAWYVKATGEVMMQRGLSRERPCFRSVAVETEEVVQQVSARHGVVWAITDNMTLLVRTGISHDTPEGVAWLPLPRHTEPYLLCGVCVDQEGVGWAVDVLGQVWFTDDVTPQNPAGSGHWWQVPLSEYFVQDSSVLDTLRSLARKFDGHKLSTLLSRKRGALLVAGEQGVWLSLDFLNTLYVCRSSLIGYLWSPAQPPQMADTTTWKQVNAATTHLTWGLAWAQQVNGDLYAITSSSNDATLTSTPAVFVSYCVNGHSVWGLTIEGQLYVRTGMGQHCPLGVAWTPLDLAQLGDAHLVQVTCNNSYVWVVDADGHVFHRIGAAAPKPGQLNPAWLPIDVYTEIVFTRVVNGPLDWMVWAVDNRRLTYVRVGVSDAMPIGKEWVHVPGIQVMDLTVSESGVWALNTSGEILFRYGVTQSNMSGNYWKKIPGCFIRISASGKDGLWAVTSSGQLVKCHSRHLCRTHDSSDPLLHRSVSTTSEEGEWELV